MLKAEEKTVAVKNRRVAMRCAGLVAVSMLTLGAVQASAEDDRRSDFKFVNIADNTSQSFAGFGTAPSINNAGAVAFIATGSSFGQGVFKWQHGELKNITARSTTLGHFGDDVVINAGGLVGFDANLNNTGERAIFTSDGTTMKIIADSIQNGLIAPFLGIGGMNASGTVIFTDFHSDQRSQAIFTGNGGPLSTIVDTASSNFLSLGNCAINDSGEVVFRAFRKDNSEAIFSGRGGATIIADTKNPAFSDFLDPVINNSGLVADGAFLSNGGVEVFTGNGGQVRPRTGPAAKSFNNVDNVTVNNSGAVAFFVDKISGGQGIFLAQGDDESPAAVIQSGDALFGSTVNTLSLGRFSLNDHSQVVFVYTLANGRSGLAIASRNGDD